MKKLSLLLLAIASMLNLTAQVGIGTTTPDAKSALDITSTTGGLLIPRMTTTEMNTLETGGLTAGMIIFNTTLAQFMGWNGTIWRNLSYEESNTEPQVSGASISGIYNTGQTLTGSYSYIDLQADPDDASTYIWKVADDINGTNEANISGATTTTYMLSSGEEGKYIQFCVTGGSLSGLSPGNQACSVWSGPSVEENVAPTALSVAISGTTSEGQYLTGNYTYSDVDGDLEGASIFRWTRSDDASGTNETDIVGATTTSYTLVSADVEKFIKFYVIPVSATGTSPGTEVGSAFVGAVIVPTSDLPYSQSFETISGYTTSVSENITETNDDYFSRTNNSSISGTFSGNFDGNFFFAAQDIDAATSSSSTQTLTITGINIAGQTGLELDILIAEDDANDAEEDWDSSDYMHIEYQIDGGGYQNLLWVENSGSTFNSAPSIDTDFDGNGDSTVITDMWTNFNTSIAGTGALLDIKITFNLNSSDEDIAIDNIRITAN